MSTVYGLKPFPLHGNLFTADLCILETWATDKDKYMQRWNAYTTPFGLVLRHGIGATPQPFFTDKDVYISQLQDIGSLVRPAFFTIENEPLDKTHHSEGAKKYCKELRLAKRFLPRDIPVTNGGFTLPHVYWYAKQTGDKRLCPGRNLDNLTDLIQEAQIEMDYIKSVRAKRFVCNAHIYISSLDQVPAVIDYLNYIKEYTGKRILSNESGIHVADPGLIAGLVQIARAVDMTHMIFFCGDGSSPAQAITVEQINEAIK